MSPIAHHYAADNLLGMQLDGRLELVGLLGHGAQGDVLLARNIAPPGLDDLYTEDCYAVKVISKLGLEGRALVHLQDEIVLHHRACSDGHTGIITLHNVIEAPNTLFLVSTFAPNGDLFERIINPLRPRLCTQPETIRSIMLQLIDIVDYLHNTKGIAHRDIKPENLFWIEAAESSLSSMHEEADAPRGSEANQQGRLLIGDFGLATDDRFAGDFGSGTSFYTSPEAAGYYKRQGLPKPNGSTLGGALLSPIHLTFDGNSGLALPSPAIPDAKRQMEWENRLSYDTFAADIWSIGIVLLNLICERNPWQHALNTDETFAAYSADPDNTLQTVLPMLSDEAHELLKRILKIDPRERMTLAQMREEVLKIETFVTGSTEELEEVLVPYESVSAWLTAAGAHRQSTPALASPASQVMSLCASSSSGWTTSDSGSGLSQQAKVDTPMSSNGPSSGSLAKPKRPLPIPLQMANSRLSSTASIPRGQLSAFPLPPASIPKVNSPAPVLTSYPLRPPATAPIIKLTTASQSVLKQCPATANPMAEVVRLKMPPPHRKSKLSNSSTLFEAVSPGLSELVASVPCQMSLSSSTEGGMSEDVPITPADQTCGGSGGDFKESCMERDGEDDTHGQDQNRNQASDQWLSVKYPHEVKIGQLDEEENNDLPPMTPAMQLGSAKAPLTPLLLTPTSGRRYHPYASSQHQQYQQSTRIPGATPTGRSVMYSPLRMAQQAFLERHYAEYARPALQQHQQYQQHLHSNNRRLQGNIDFDGIGKETRDVGMGAGANLRRGSLPA